MRRTLNSRRSGALICAVVAVMLLWGCAADDVPGGSQLEASSGTTNAALDVPDGEASSIGTYVLSITTPEVGEDGDESVEIITGEREGTVTGLWADDVTGDGIVDVVVVRVVSPGAGGAVVGTWTVWDVVGAGPPLGGSSPMRAYEPIVVIVG